MKIRITIFLSVFIFLLSSCKKDRNADNAAAVKGTIMLEVHSIHHTWDVSGIKVYLKKNVTEFPGMDSTLYDISGQADGYGIFTFENLFHGNYYVYASGYDAYFGAHVYGYSPVVLDAEHVTDNKASLTLYVSE
jgi:hypothetical protein